MAERKMNYSEVEGGGIIPMATLFLLLGTRILQIQVICLWRSSLTHLLTICFYTDTTSQSHIQVALTSLPHMVPDFSEPFPTTQPRPGQPGFSLNS